MRFPIRHSGCLTASEASELAARQKTSSSFIAEKCFQRIDGREDLVGAFEFLDRDQIRSDAARLDLLPALSALHGIPIAIKDVFDTAEMPTEFNSPIYRRRRPGSDADCVARLRQAGALIFGKTVTAEFAHVQPGRTQNPLNLAFSPGGSSSGSAAAVCDGFVPLAIGTQTGGSTIRPASYCGVFGFKPTYGAVSMRGVKPLAPTLDTIGYFARSICDLELLHAVLVGHPKKVVPRYKPLRFGVVVTSFSSLAAPDAIEALKNASRAFLDAGILIEEVVLPNDFDGLPTAALEIIEREASISLRDEYEKHYCLLSKDIILAIERGQNQTEDAVSQSYDRRQKCMSLIETISERFDALLTFSAGGEAPRGNASGDSLFNRSWTALGLPCLNLPVCSGRNDLPIGVQLIGSRHRDFELLANAKLAWSLIQARSL